MVTPKEEFEIRKGAFETVLHDMDAVIELETLRAVVEGRIIVLDDLIAKVDQINSVYDKE